LGSWGELKNHITHRLAGLYRFMRLNHLVKGERWQQRVLQTVSLEHGIQACEASQAVGWQQVVNQKEL
jgi:hypothetical protein